MTLRRSLRDFRVPVAFIAGGSLLITAYFMLHDGSGPAFWLPHILLVGAVNGSAAVAVLVGTFVYKPLRRGAWFVIAASQFVYFAADVCFYTYHDALGNFSYPAPSEALYIAHYPLLAAGLFMLARRSSDRSVLIDTLIFGTSAALFSWIVLIAPYASGGFNLANVTSLAFPVMDLMVLVAAVRLYVLRSVRTPALYLLATALVLLLFTDAAYGWMQISGTYSVGNYLDAAWMSYYLLLGATALHPSMHSLGHRARANDDSTLSRTRMGLLVAASLAAPSLILAQTLAHQHVDVIPSAAASLILFVLVALRLWGVNAGQKRALSSLHTVQAEREKLLARVVQVAEQERSRVAINLHDGPIQNLTAVGFLTELMMSRLKSGDVEAAMRHAASVRDQIALEMVSLRTLMAELRPPVLDERGLAAALAECAETTLSGTGVSVSKELTQPLCAPEVETVLFRIAREALVNIRKHSNAATVVLRLTPQGGSVVLAIRDDGDGFDLGAAGEDEELHLGLTSMRELAGSVGGRISIETAPGRGTVVRAVAPTKEAAIPAAAAA